MFKIVCIRLEKYEKHVLHNSDPDHAEYNPQTFLAIIISGDHYLYYGLELFIKLYKKLYITKSDHMHISLSIIIHSNNQRMSPLRDRQSFCLN